MFRLSDKIIKYSFYLLFILVPLIMTPFNYELFEFNKMILTYLLTAIIAAAWLIKMITSKKFIFKRTPLDIGILFFLISQIVSTIFSIDRHTSIFGYYSRSNGGLLSIICYILLYYAFVSNFHLQDRRDPPSTGKHLGGVFTAMLFSGGFVAIYGILEHFGIDSKYWVQDVRNRVFSTLGQPNWLAAYLVGLIPLIWAFSLQNEKSKTKRPYTSCFILYTSYFILYACLLFTRSRSGFLGFIASYLVFWSLSFWQEKKRVIKSFLVFTFFILVLSFLIGTPFSKNFQFLISNFQTKKQTTTQNQPPITNRQSPITNITPSSKIREIVWKGAVEVWRHNPLLGTGPETFAYSYYWYRPREHNDTSEWDFLYNKAHNEYLNYLATTGIFGLGSYLILILAFIYWSLKQIFNFQFVRLWRRNLWQSQTFSIFNLGFLAGYIGLLVCRFFGFSVVITNLFFFLFPAIAFTFSRSVNRNPHRVWNYTYTSEKFSVIQFWSLITISLFTFYLLFSTFRLWYSDFLFAKGEKYTKTNNIVQAFNYLQKASKLNQSEPLFKSELSNAASSLALALYLEKQASASGRLADFSIQQSNQAIRISPYNLNYLKMRTKVFYNLAQIDKKYYQNALKTLLRAQELAPTDPKITYNLSVLYDYLGQKNEALEMLKKTIKLKPNYETAKKKLKRLEKSK